MSSQKLNPSAQRIEESLRALTESSDAVVESAAQTLLYSAIPFGSVLSQHQIWSTVHVVINVLAGQTYPRWGTVSVLVAAITNAVWHIQRQYTELVQLSQKITELWLMREGPIWPTLSCVLRCLEHAPMTEELLLAIATHARIGFLHKANLSRVILAELCRTDSVVWGMLGPENEAGIRTIVDALTSPSIRARVTFFLLAYGLFPKMKKDEHFVHPRVFLEPRRLFLESLAAVPLVAMDVTKFWLWAIQGKEISITTAQLAKLASEFNSRRRLPSTEILRLRVKVGLKKKRQEKWDCELTFCPSSGYVLWPKVPNERQGEATDSEMALLTEIDSVSRQDRDLSVSFKKGKGEPVVFSFLTVAAAEEWEKIIWGGRQRS